MAREPSSSGSPRPEGVAGRLPWLACALLVGVPLLELGGHAVVQAGVVTAEDWRRAAQAVSASIRPGDAVLAAPDWADPSLRRVLGRRIPLPAAGWSDLDSFERVWLLSVRGADRAELPETTPTEDQRVGPIRVRRWDLGPSPVLMDLVDAVPRASVTLGGRPCPWQTRPRGQGGGLGAGPFIPASRHLCDPRRAWLWVGATVTEDLSLRPRRCVWQHPEGTEPVVTTYRDVPLGDRVVLYAGLYYEHERERVGGPVMVQVSVNGRPVGTLTHRDGDGWKRLEARTGAPPGARGDVAIEVTSPEPRFRSLCWAATTRQGVRGDDQ